MAFNVPINSIAPTTTPSDWVRPADWITITDTADEVQFLVADTGAKAFTITTTFTRTSGDIYIDWGDGVTDTVTTTTSTDTSHVYSTGGTPCSRGYNTFKIRIYGDATCVITNAKHIPNVAVTGGSPYYSIGVLEAYFGDNTCTSNAFLSLYFWARSATAGNGTFDYLEYVKLPQTVLWTSQFTSMFSNCTNLYKVVMPTSASALTNFSSAFSLCVHLLDIAIPSNATGITLLLSAFSNCYNLRSVTFPTTLNSCTTLNTLFSNCYSLRNVTLPSINLVTDTQSMCAGCVSLQWFKFTSMPSPASAGVAVNCTSMFALCTSLQNVYFPSSCSSNAVYNMSSVFSTCYALIRVTFPVNFAANTLNSCFSGASNLTKVTFQASMPLLTDVGLCFNSCVLLTSVDLPTTTGTASFSSTFNNCNLLSEITFPSGSNIANLAGTFQNCRNLIKVILPNNGQNGCTTMSSTFTSCFRLETVILPTSLNAVNTINSTFSSCYNLKSVVFPAVMNAVTSAGSTFGNCYSLKSATLPTSMSACTNFANTFQNCYTIEDILLPSTVSTSLTTFGGLAQNCTNLKSLTLPTTQTSLLNTLTSFISNAGSLTTVTNAGKLGSLTTTPLVAATFNGANQIPSLSFNCPFASLQLFGQGPTFLNKLTSLRLLNTSAGQWTGVSPQLNVQYSDLGVAALDQLFTDLTTVTSKTINITGCTGAAGCTRSIATAKGWIVTG